VMLEFGFNVTDYGKTILAADLNVDLLVIGARGHSALYERMVGSRTDRIMHLARCPVLVVK
jgi:nucleotide-binding universal stress UspA family protein